MNTRFAYVAVETARGPHVTPVLYARAGGVVWFLVPRGSLKARVLRKRPRAGVLLRDGERSEVLGGTVRLLDFLRAPAPRSLPRLAQSPLAVASYSARNPLELAGFALDGLASPRRLMVPDLLLAAFEPDRGAVVQRNEIERSWGRWPRRRVPGRGARAVRRAAASAAPLPELPAEVASLPAGDGDAVLGWLSPAGPLTLPATWEAGRGRARVPGELTELAGIGEQGPACVTFDATDGARPTSKRGLMLRGTGRLGSAGRARTAAIDVDRASWWVGFRIGTSEIEN
jgi:hypothetical protein